MMAAQLVRHKSAVPLPFSERLWAMIFRPDTATLSELKKLYGDTYELRGILRMQEYAKEHLPADAAEARVREFSQLHGPAIN